MAVDSSSFADALNRLLDVVNLGRVISIFLPGVVASFAFLIFLAGVAQVPGFIGEAVQRKSITETNSVTGEVIEREESTSSERVYGSKFAEDVGNALEGRGALLLGAFIFGITLSQLGYIVIRTLYKPIYDRLHRGKSLDEGESKYYIIKEGVDTIYYYPFFRKHSKGDIPEKDYYHYLIVNYYRFVEFNINMALALLLSGVLFLVYFSVTEQSLRYSWVLGAFLISAMVILLYGGYNSYRRYRRASVDLIRGIVDAEREPK
ncbi:MAG: hypothetical protein ACUVXI_02565 [bacterium]